MEIRVQIKYLSALRDRTGRRHEEVAFGENATLQDVADWLNSQRGLRLPDARIMATLNGKGWNQYPSGLSTPLSPGDVVCLFPPVSGG
jgi:MoaD family protein